MIGTNTYRNYFMEEFLKMLSVKFPTVKDFRLEDYVRVKPVEYFESGRERKAYPPVARWKIGDTRYSYVLKPTFIKRPWKLWPISGVDIEVTYNDEIDTVLKVIEQTVAGIDMQEINQRLGNIGRPSDFD